MLQKDSNIFVWALLSGTSSSYGSIQTVCHRNWSQPHLSIDRFFRTLPQQQLHISVREWVVSLVTHQSLYRPFSVIKYENHTVYVIIRNDKMAGKIQNCQNWLPLFKYHQIRQRTKCEDSMLADKTKTPPAIWLSSHKCV